MSSSFGGNLSNASATLNTYYGKLSSGWKIEKDKIIVDVEIPAKTNATVHIHATDAGSITESGLAISASKDILVLSKAAGYVKVKLGSGTFHFNNEKK